MQLLILPLPFIVILEKNKKYFAVSFQTSIISTKQLIDIITPVPTANLVPVNLIMKYAETHRVVARYQTLHPFLHKNSHRSLFLQQNTAIFHGKLQSSIQPQSIASNNSR